MGGFIRESQGVRNTFVHELTSVHLPGTSFWENRGGFLTFLLFSFILPEFFVKTQKHRTFVWCFYCVSLLSTHFVFCCQKRCRYIIIVLQWFAQFLVNLLTTWLLPKTTLPIYFSFDRRFEIVI